MIRSYLTVSHLTEHDTEDVLWGRLTASAEELDGLRRARLSALVRHAVDASPYYRRKLGSMAADAPLAELPTLSKQDLMDRFDEIVTVPGLRLADLTAHIAGPYAGEPYAGLIVLATSGSTGVPGIFVYTPEQMAVAVAALRRTVRLFGITPDMRLAGVGSAGPVHISRHLVAGLLAGRPVRPPRLTVTDPLPVLTAALREYAPDALITNCSMLDLLAAEQLAGRLRIAPAVVAGTGDVLTEDAADRVEQAWGVRAQQFYATTETGLLASSEPGRAGLRVWDDLVILEVVDDQGRPTPPGQPGSRVLVTNLTGRVQPLIRYEITEVVTPAASAAGPGPSRLAAVDGRADDVLDLPGASGGRVLVHPAAIRLAVAKAANVSRYQVVHDGAGLAVSLVLDAGAEPGEAVVEGVRTALVAALREAGAAPVPVTVTPVAELGPLGPGGKFAVVRRRPPAEADAG